MLWSSSKTCIGHKNLFNLLHGCQARVTAVKKKKNSSQKSIFCNAHQYFFETIKKAGGLASLSIWYHPFSKVLKKHLIYCIIHARGSINNFVVVAVCNYHAVVDSIVDVALHRWHKL